MGSLPSRERELKLLSPWGADHRPRSLPSRERELKLIGEGKELVMDSRSLHGSVN